MLHDAVSPFASELGCAQLVARLRLLERASLDAHRARLRLRLLEARNSSATSAHVHVRGAAGAAAKLNDAVAHASFRDADYFFLLNDAPSEHSNSDSRSMSQRRSADSLPDLSAEAGVSSFQASLISNYYAQFFVQVKRLGFVHFLIWLLTDLPFDIREFLFPPLQLAHLQALAHLAQCFSRTCVASELH